MTEEGSRILWLRKRIFLLSFLLLIFLGIGWFVGQVYQNYRAIRAGKTSPFAEQQLQASFSTMVANSQVSPEDLARLSVKDAPTLGRPGARLTIVEFLDFDCPFCRASFGPVREMMEKYKDQVFFVVRDFPIEDLHPRALASALAAGCAQAQGKFWPYHDKLFLNQDQHEDQDLLNYARQIGLDEQQFSTCYQHQTYKNKVLADLQDGLQVGVQGTPTFFFNGVKIQGALDQNKLEFLIQQFLKR